MRIHSLKASRIAFTLIELLVSLGILILLMGLLLPGLTKAREQTRYVVCRSNVRQLAVANDLYAKEQRGVYVPGASEFLANLHRWHGQRENLNSSFVSSHGPLQSYLGATQEIRACPQFAPEKPGFETGCGGYGYNNAYIGVQGIKSKSGAFRILSDRAGAYADKIKRPADTLMFSDSAFAADALIEYSFAEPRYHPRYQTRADPSIHFRHAGAASVAWSDTHVSSEKYTFTWSSGMYTASTKHHAIGWFGETDTNGAFDLE